MATLTLNVKVVIIDDQGETDIPMPEKSVTFTAKEDKKFVISAASTQIIWNPTIDSSEATTDFDFLILFPDGDLELETTTNEGDVNEELNIDIIADGFPYILGSDASRSNHSVNDAFAGTLDVKDKLRVKNLGATAVNLRMVMVT